MNTGVVVGGWGFVWAAYVLTGLSFLIYGVTLIASLRNEETRAEMDGDTK